MNFQRNFLPSLHSIEFEFAMVVRERDFCWKGHNQMSSGKRIYPLPQIDPNDLLTFYSLVMDER